MKTMSNKRFWLGIAVMALVFGMTVIGCKNDDSKKVPEWAQGTWYSDPSGTSGRYKAAEITASQFIEYTPTSWVDVSTVTESDRYDCTGVKGDIVEFASGPRDLQIRKRSSSNQIDIDWIGDGSWSDVFYK
jgi:hypothetical protein